MTKKLTRGQVAELWVTHGDEWLAQAYRDRQFKTPTILSAIDYIAKEFGPHRALYFERYCNSLIKSRYPDKDV